nr:sensor domain-containing diguanylate cyclase [uncultured Anaeromusa sp.]
MKFSPLDYQQYRLIVESSPNMIWRAGTDKLCNYFNETWLQFTGRTMEQELGNGWLSNVHPDDIESCATIYYAAFDLRQRFEMDYRLRRHDGEYRWINDRGVPYYANGTFEGYIGSCMDVTEKFEGQKLKKQAQQDGLCKIYNRHYSDILIQKQFEHAKRTNSSFSLLMIDLDNFKAVNDHLGHQAGDMVLQQVSTILTNSTRSQDIVGRYGGEEFIVSFSDVAPNIAWDISERIRTSIANNSFHVQQENENAHLSITASLGLSHIKPGDTITTLVLRADQSLYLAKASGKNCTKSLS